MKASVCVICQRAMEVKKNEVVLIKTMGEYKEPYSVWQGDLWRCSKCGFELVTGFGDWSICNESDDEFDEKLQKQLNRGVPIFYCHEK